MCRNWISGYFCSKIFEKIHFSRKYTVSGLGFLGTMMSAIFHNLMTFFIIPKKKVCENLSSTKALTYALSFWKKSFQPVVDRRARRENNKMNNTHAELNFYSSSNEKGVGNFKNFKWKILIGVLTFSWYFMNSHSWIFFDHADTLYYFQFSKWPIF